ncbi:Phosphatidylinositol transfer protein beta [Fasciola hepatica]|uniref:Phosphatidylinositol transfer protein beta n=1 Tax=Fasciola hepatica TaxID=6192 RepID=A0A2H1CJP6_FASHE|nr:Phosphatidylinositol transfer protein beta [Fasciola hepatica]
MLIKEFRIILPMTVDEFMIGQLYTVAEMSKNEPGGGDGVEILMNEPFTSIVNQPNPPLLNGDPLYTKGQYTHKCYHLSQKVPDVVRALAPSSALVFNEYAWNAYPYCRTAVTNNFMESFNVTVESLHSPDITLENAHRLSPAELKGREVVTIDIGSPEQCEAGNTPEDNPTIFRSVKTGRGPLCPSWWTKGYSGQMMCAYKLVRCECRIPLLQGRLESMIQKQERRLFANFHRQVFCWIDRWICMTIEDIRNLEEQTRLELEEQRAKNSLRGHCVEE